MFNNEIDFDLDDDILFNSFTPQNTTSNHKTVTNTKRHYESEKNEGNKKLKSDSSLREPNLQNDTFCNTRQVVKRKFPGPAGLLPENPFTTSSLNDETNNQISPTIVCSQRTVSDFEDDPWQRMCEDLESSNAQNCFLPNLCNIAWIKSSANKHRLPNQKAPFLAAIIQSLEFSEGKICTINVTLKDMTGQIQASLVQNLYEEHSEDLTIGSVIVLKQFSVLTAGYNNHYLVITSNNLVSIYSIQKSSQDVTNSVNKIVIQDIFQEEILKIIRDVESNHKICSDSTNLNFNKQNGLSNVKKPNLSKIVDSNKKICNNFIDSDKNGTSFISNCPNNVIPKCSDNKDVKGKFKFFKNTNCDRLPVNAAETESRSKNNKSINVFETKDCQLDYLDFDDDIIVPDNFEEKVEKEMEAKTDVTNKNWVDLTPKSGDSGKVEGDNEKKSGCSQTSVKFSDENVDLWKNVFDGVDTDSFFEDF